MQAVTTRLARITAHVTLATRETVIIALISTNVQTTAITVTQIPPVQTPKVLSTARVMRAMTEMDSTVRI